MVLLRAEGISEREPELILISGTVLISFCGFCLLNVDNDLDLFGSSWASTVFGLLRLMMMLASAGENLPGQFALILLVLLADLLVRIPSRWAFVLVLDN